MKKVNAILFLLGAAFLAYLLWRIDFSELCHQVGILGWGLIPLVLCEGVSEFIHVAGWRCCLSGPHRSMPIRLLLPIRLAGYAINYLTPTGAMGGEVTKATLLASYHRGPEAVTGVLIGKVCFAFAHLLFVVIGSILCLWRIDLPHAVWLAMLISAGLIGSGMLAFLLLQKYGKLGVLVHWLAKRNVGGSILRRAAQGMSEVDEALKLFYQQRPLDLLKAVCWHQVGYTVGIFQAWLFFKLLHQHSSWALASGIWFLGMWFDLLTFAVPMNVGTLEGTRIVALRAIGYSSVLGMTYAVALRLAQLFWSAVGLLLYAWLMSRVGPHQSDGGQNPARAPVASESERPHTVYPRDLDEPSACASE
jgi:hypothetical protein